MNFAPVSAQDAFEQSNSECQLEVDESDNFWEESYDDYQGESYDDDSEENDGDTLKVRIF